MLKVSLYLEPKKVEQEKMSEDILKEKTAILHSIKQPEKSLINIYKT